jgi:methionyl-tRNA formyltransferase
MIARSGDGPPPLRVALCHLESLVCLPAINRLFIQMGDEIGLVILSNRFASKHGGLVRQFVANARRSGFRLTLWLGFDIVAAQVAGRIGRWIETLTRRRPRLASVRVLANRHGATMLDVPAINSSETIGALRSYAPDVVLVMNFDQVLRREFIAAAPGQIINVHPSLLPALRGPCPVFWALAEGRDEAGVSLHLIEDENIDAGAVLAQRTRPLDRARSVAEITAALFEQGAVLVPEVVRAVREGRAVGRPQDVEGASYRGFPDRADVARARQAGVRLCRFWQLAKLLMMAVGVAARPLEATTGASSVRR